MAFSASDAAFEGFRLTRERPGVIVALCVFQFVVSAITLALLIGLLGDDLAEFQRASQAGPAATPAEAMALFGPMLKVDAVALPLSLISTSVVFCTIFRAVLRPERAPLGGLRFGGDELRMMLLLVILSLLFMGAVMAFGLTLGLVLGVAGAVAKPAATVAALVGIAVLFAGALWIGVRLSLAPAMTFADRRLRVFASWPLTRGRFWSLFGAYLLAWALAIVVAVLIYAVFAAVVVLVGGGVGAMSRVFQPDLSSFERLLTPTTLLYTVVNAVISALTYAIVVSPAAIACREFGRERA